MVEPNHLNQRKCLLKKQMIEHHSFFVCFVIVLLQTLIPNAINFSTVSSRKKNVNTKFIKLRTSRSIGGAS